MNHIQRFRISNQNEMDEANTFLTYKLGIMVDKEDINCKICLCSIPRETVIIKNNFWTCPKGHTNKYKENAIHKNKFFEFNISKIINVIETKIDSRHVENKGSYLIYKSGDNSVPIFFFDMPQDAGLFNESIKRNGFFIYYNENAKSKLTNSYNENNFMTLQEFLSSDNNRIIKLLESISKAAYPLETLSIIQKINNFITVNGSSRFEDQCQNFFEGLKLNERQVVEFLDFLKHNKNNPSGNKFVKIGSNYPVDIVPIELYSYFSGILRITSDKGFDAKMYSTTLTNRSYKEKKESNTGRQLVFIVSTNQIDNAVWRDIIRGKENSGNWVHFIIDLDLLSLLLYYVGYKGYFN